MTTTQPQRDYQATFILNTVGVSEDVETLIEKLRETLTRLKATVKEHNNLGYRDFVRVTDKKHPGDYYVTIDFSGPTHTASALQEELRLDKTVKRIYVAAA